MFCKQNKGFQEKGTTTCSDILIDICSKKKIGPSWKEYFFAVGMISSFMTPRNGLRKRENGPIYSTLCYVQPTQVLVAIFSHLKILWLCNVPTAWYLHVSAWSFSAPEQSDLRAHATMLPWRLVFLKIIQLWGEKPLNCSVPYSASNSRGSWY